MKRIKLLKH